MPEIVPVYAGLLGLVFVYLSIRVIRARRQEQVALGDGDNPRPGTLQVPLIEVPNPLNAKATGDVNVNDLQRDIDRVTKVLNQQKMERHASGGRDIVSGQEAG